MKLLYFLLILATTIACNSNKTTSNTLDLNGDWQFRQAGKTAWTKATVPGVVQLDLLRAGLIEDPFYGKNEAKIGWIELANWEYERNFEVDENLLEQEAIDLVFEGLDTYAEVFLNGKKILETDNMFCTWTIACKEHLQVGKNTLLVRFQSPIKKQENAYKNLGYQLPAGNDAGQLKVSPFVRKAPYHFGWDWGPRIVTMGIWRPVRLEAYSIGKIADVYVEQQNVSAEWANINTQISLDILTKNDFELLVKNGDSVLCKQTIHAEKGKQVYELKFDLKNPKLWWSNGLGEPHLYAFTIELKQKDKVISSQTKKIGLRKIELVQETDSIGTNYYFKLNGVPVFMKGANYIPQDNLLPRVTTENYNTLINNALSANMNMLRVWGGGIYEADIFYDLCDEKGILVWQDFMFACSMYPSDAAFLENVRKEVQQNVKRLRNHACIALWCGNNEMDVAWKNWGWQKEFGYSIADSTTIIEGYKKLFHELIPQELKALKTHREYVSTSPLSNWGRPENFNHHSMHYWGVWHGKEPFEKYRENVGRFMSEYGFQSFPEMATIQAFADSSQWNLESEVMQHHQKSYIGNGMIMKHLEQYFPKPNDFQEFVYLSQLTQALGIGIAINSHRQNRRCMGTLYWQINDCWTGPSWSSIDYFGRWKALHYQVRDLYKDVLIILHPTEKRTVEIIVSSDKLENIKGQLKLEMIDFSGQQIWQEEKEVSIAANNSQVIQKQDFGILLQQNNPNKLFLKATFTTATGSYQQLHYFEAPKNLILDQPNIEKQFRKVAEGYELELLSNTLVKNLQITTTAKDARFSDNYVDLLPKEKKVILIKTKEEIKIENIHFLSVNQIKK